MTIDYLLLGHIARDETPDGPQLGGTVTYSGIVALAMGLRVAVVTSARPDDPVLAQLDPGIERHIIPAESSTIFRNEYDGSRRTQYTLGQAATLSIKDVPAAWRSAPIVHLGPLVQELDDTLLPESFPGAEVGVTPQGWLRAWDGGGRIYPIPWENAARLLPAASVTILSEEDLGSDSALEAKYARLAPRLVVTRAYNGATLYMYGVRTDFSVPEIEGLCHPTGAGDVFAAAMLAQLHRQPGAWATAVQVAVHIASVFVETCGEPGVPSLATMRAILDDTRVRAVMP